MDDGLYVQVLQDRRAGVGYLYLNFRDYKGIFQQPEHRMFVGSEENSACLLAAHPSLVDTYTKYVLIVDFDISESNEVVEASKMFVKKMASLA